MNRGYTISALGDASLNVDGVDGARTTIVLEKLPGLPLRAQVSTYPPGELQTPTSVEWGPLEALAPRLGRRLGLTRPKVVNALMRQRAPQYILDEAARAMDGQEVAA
jgi:hypothetical protein